MPQFPCSLSVFFPVYNEEQNIELLIIEANRLLPSLVAQHEIIIVDDGSTDSTGEIVNRLIECDPHIRLIRHKRNQGYGAALRNGLKAARYDYVFFTDADCQFKLGEIGELLQHVPEYDAVIGYRKERRDRLPRLINAKGWNILNRWLLGLRVRDINCAFKLFKREVVQSIEILSSGAMFSAELLIRLKSAGIAFKEVPVTHLPRLKGTATGGNISVIIKAISEFASVYNEMNETIGMHLSDADHAVQSGFLVNRVPKLLIVINALLTVIYLLVVTFCFGVSNKCLFVLLVSSQIFFTWQALTFLYTIWEMNHLQPHSETFGDAVDVFITCVNEPLAVIEQTLAGCLAMQYPNFKVYLLNDGRVTKSEGWQDIEVLAARLGAGCITRTISGGAKAGNINNGLHQTNAPFVAVFDADHVPHKDFLAKMMGYFADDASGFVQSPQFYRNFAASSLSGGAWEQQELFFGAICKGKNRLNAAPMCGTNMVIRRKAIEQMGGFCEKTLTEDFLTGLLMHERGWKSVYVPEVLSEGLAPQDFLSYCRQQHRWARGCLDVLIKHNPALSRGLSLGQKIQYLSSASFYLSGVFVLINIAIPLVFFFFGAIPFSVPTDVLAMILVPYIFLTIYTLQRSTNFSYTFRSLSFSFSCWPIYLQALYGLLTGHKTRFAVTAKYARSGNFLYLVLPHLIYFAFAITGFCVALFREGFSASVVTNLAWVIVNSVIFLPFIYSAVAGQFAPSKKNTSDAVGQMA